MKKSTVVLLSVFMSFLLYAQKPVTLIDSEFRIRNQSSDNYYFHLAKGDNIVFDLKMSDSLTLRSVSFEEYQGGILYREIQPSEIKSKSVLIQHDGIYFFELHQQGFLAGKRSGHFKAVRYPDSEKNENFNTTVYWRTLTDTIWYEEPENLYIRTDTVSEMIVMQHVELGKKKTDNRAVIHFSVPDSTLCWAWCVSAGVDGDMTYNGISENMYQSNAIVRNHGLMTYLALGGNASFTEKPDMTSVLVDLTTNKNAADYFLNTDDNDPQSFRKVSFGYERFCNDSVHSKSLLLLNNSRKRVTAFVFITAVRITDVYETVPVMKYRIEERQVPYTE